ncbi:Delta-aminolevulinic acid dehydratase OS=Streptomyces microflavus OX=1919 GN=hemB PE=3 SV=1 [Streptomyces microflavus]
MTAYGNFPGSRPRRLRTTPAMRRMVAETRLDPANLILPAFVREGIDAPVAISAMPGVHQHTLDTLRKAAVEAVSAGVSGIMLFGVPEDAKKDARGTAGTDPDGILQVALRAVREEVGDDLVVMSDLCLDEYTDHGHCGVLTADGRVDNDATLERYAEMAQVQADAGAHVVGPSGMMDGQVGVVRDALDQTGYEDVSILAYTAKYSSAFYGPFREAVGSSLTGDRKTYQQDPANARESLRELALDLEEGADMVMVKPAGPYLDILAKVAESVDVPVAAYQISGEYAMIEAAAEKGWIDRDKAILESLTGIRRAGAQMILTYWATEVAQWARTRQGLRAAQGLPAPVSWSRWASLMEKRALSRTSGSWSARAVESRAIATSGSEV